MLAESSTRRPLCSLTISATPIRTSESPRRPNPRPLSLPARCPAPPPPPTVATGKIVTPSTCRIGENPASCHRFFDALQHEIHLAPLPIGCKKQVSGAHGKMSCFR